MLSLYPLLILTLIIFFLAASGFLFSGNMLKKCVFSVLMFLAAFILLLCLTPQEKTDNYYLVLFIISLAEICSSLAIISAMVAELHTFDSGAIKEDI